jgi:DNA-binding transcriptional MerR regulator
MSRRQVDPNYFATLEDLMAAAGASERTIRNWLERGLVPMPVKVSLGYPNGVFNRYPAYACEQVRFIAAMRAEGLSLDEIHVLVAARDWSGASLAPPAGIPSRDVAPPPASAAKRRRRRGS